MKRSACFPFTHDDSRWATCQPQWGSLSLPAWHLRPPTGPCVVPARKFTSGMARHLPPPFRPPPAKASPSDTPVSLCPQHQSNPSGWMTLQFVSCWADRICVCWVSYCSYGSNSMPLSLSDKRSDLSCPPNLSIQKTVLPLDSIARPLIQGKAGWGALTCRAAALSVMGSKTA